jgi:hypothetical protein
MAKVLTGPGKIKINKGLPDNSKVTHFFYEEAGLLFLK